MVWILGLCASPRVAATDFCVQEALKAAREVGEIETEYISLRGKEIKPCLHCDKCLDTGLCIHKDDALPIIEAFFRADGIIIGSPVYDMNIPAQLAALFNRFRMRFVEVCDRSPRALEYKVAGAIAVGGSRNGGQEIVLGAILNFCLAEGMIVVGGEKFQNHGAAVWSQDRKRAGAEEDEIGLAAVRAVGRRVAKVASLIVASKEIWIEKRRG
ncbi:Multimeric flavodoxin WrbA [Thermanaeromonas toyohensis ToBE]|uniref:Multimeric flavodoxin WrbA n=1 Tax=Thermanaeromonas toyohensis ToBE TaxID=698762 RepID=A0A1W1VG22_9FIRM|nr:flavodoxin family protein [Thermanaeromonas toyohensis]SMB92180.1 Multimeric flavodoxin WrbA [Thermanaeromonas toyohensis ToBE]